MLVGGLVLFCLFFGVFNVLGFPILESPQAYNIGGFTPLSILAVYGFTLASCRSTWIVDQDLSTVDRRMMLETDLMTIAEQEILDLAHIICLSARTAPGNSSFADRLRC